MGVRRRGNGTILRLRGLMLDGVERGIKPCKSCCSLPEDSSRITIKDFTHTHQPPPAFEMAHTLPRKMSE